MTIRGVDEEWFRGALRENLTPSRPISSPEHLKGRARLLRDIGRAFNSPGKHVFIYGHRGVGKTSLAQTAAAIHQSSDAEPIAVGCSAAPFLSIVVDAIKAALAADEDPRRKIETKVKAGIAGFGIEQTRSLLSGNIPDPASVNDAVQLLRVVAEIHSREPVIIFDEFDQVVSPEEKKVCAQIIKQVSDLSINVRLIFCGIGDSLVELIGSHLSTGRYLAPFEVERLTHDARWEILEVASSAVGLSISKHHMVRIGQISDGFPSYIHLIGEQLLWTVFDDEQEHTVCHQHHFDEGVNRAVHEAQPTLKTIYDVATQKHSDDYQEVLWALADDHLLRRQTTSVYEASYLRIMESRQSDKRPVLNKAQFSGRLNNLKTERHGKIIRGTGSGWYEFSENIVRGYVRLRAQQAGIEIGVEGFA